MAKKINNEISVPIQPSFNWYEIKKKYSHPFGDDRIIEVFYFEFSTKVNKYFAEMFLFEGFQDYKGVLISQRRYLEDLITEFQKVFSLKETRVSGNYFDDLCQLEIESINRKIAEKQNPEISVSKENEEQLEPLPEFNFDTDTKKIAWLYELSVLKVVLEKCKDGDTYNFRRAANIIHTFTGINNVSLRKCMNAIYSPGSDQKNNPLKNADNNIFVSEMCQKFRIKTTK